jgi:tetratricopeptide (TPR) repeat protein
LPCELSLSNSHAHRLRSFGLLLVSLAAALSIVACGGNSEAESHFNQGRADLEDGSLEQAIDEFDTAIRLDPEFVEAYEYRAWVYIHLAEYGRAIADSDAALHIDPEYSPAYGSRAAAYAYLREYDQSVADLDSALRINPNYAGAYLGRAVAYIALEEFDRAIADYDAYLRINPDDAIHYAGRGVVKQLAGDAQGAEQDFRKARELGYEP